MSETAVACNAGNVDDHTFLDAEFNHLGGGLASTQEDSREVYVNDGLPLLQGHLLFDLAVNGLDQEAVTGDTCVVDETVEGAEVGGHAAKKLFDLGLDSDVGLVATGIDPEVFAEADGGVDVVLIEVDDCDVGALAGEEGGKSTANAAAGAGDNDDFLLQVHDVLLGGAGW